jgi:F-type H+-transporting ATPase subunit alpha
MQVGLQVAEIFAATKGFLDDLEKSKIAPFLVNLSAFLAAKHQPLLDKIEARAKLNDVEADLAAAIKTFKASFV